MGFRVGVIGAAGYAGVELVRILSRHPEFDLVVITSNADAGQLCSDVYPALQGVCDLEYSTHDDPRLFNCDVVFLATPHTVAMNMAPLLIEKYIAVFDLSADYRLKNKDVYEHWYGVEHTSADLLEKAVFGLPEIAVEDMHTAHRRYGMGYEVLVACAGCYPTATSLAAYPAIGLTEGVIVADAISGLSGAGRGATNRTHFCSASENFEAYGVARHRHTPEIEQILGVEGRLVFTPHLAPASRGLLSTVTMQLSEEARAKHTLESIHELYKTAYNDHHNPFVTVLPLGKMPQTSAVIGTNNAHIGLAYHESTGCLIAVCAIDNLLKGAAGQAVQCANLVCGNPQTMGLELTALPA